MVEQKEKDVLETKDLSIFYGDFRAVKSVSLSIPKNTITAIIGPSGCGKSTLLRTFNRMNEFIADTRVEGEVLLDGVDIYSDKVDEVALRRQVGMVFQKPNPFPKSIFNNVAWGPKINGYKGNMMNKVVGSLKKAALFKEVEDKLDQSGLSLSGGQQQRLCIARTIAMEPEVILMDEPCSALDPISTGAIEDLLFELKKKFTIVIVTHNMQQAARVSDYTAFMYQGELIEFDRTDKIFTNPKEKRTEDYIRGRFG